MSKIEITIENFLKNNLKDFDLPLSLEASANLSQGHLTSDILIRYAQKVKQSPEKITNQLIPVMPIFSDDYRVVLESGYLNIFIERYSPELLADFQQIPQSQIYLPLSAIGRRDQTFLRILSLAIVQLIFSQKKAQLIVFGEQYLETFSHPTLDLLTLRPVVNDLNIQESFSPVFASLASSDCRFATLWLGPEQFNKAEISKVYRDSFSSAIGFQVQIPHASWLKDLDQEIIHKYRETNNLSELIKLSLLLSGFEPSTDLFYDEAVLPQRNNLGWYLEVTERRLEVLAISAKAWSAELLLTDLSKPLQDLIWSMLLLPAYRQKAVTKGLVPDFLAKIYDFLDRFNLFFNSPQLRHKILNQTCSDLEQEILAGGLALVTELRAALKFP